MRRRGRLHRMFAVAMAVVLLAGQGELSALAQERPALSVTEISDEEEGVPAEPGGEDDDTGSDSAEKGENDGAGNGGAENGEDSGAGNGSAEKGENDGAGNGGAENGEDSDVENGIIEGGEDGGTDAGGQGNGENTEKESVSENDLAEKENIAPLAESGEKALAVGEEFVDDAGVKYRVTEDGHAGVIGHEKGILARGDLVIPETVSKDGSVYTVTSIEDNAFHLYERLTSIEIPDTVTRVGTQAFMSCKRLEHMEIPKGVTSIENAVFYGCSNLKSVILPDGITKIEDVAFENCISLENVELPDSVNSIGDRAFAFCESISSIKMQASLSSIGKMAFYECKKFNTLQIVAASKETVNPASVGSDAFGKIPADRSIVFLAEDGRELTGEALEAAKMAYLDDGRDGNAADETWWGWKIKRPAPAETFAVTIHVKKDMQPWSGHGRTFALSSSADGSFLTGDSQTADGSYSIGRVPEGVYRIYDITGIRADLPDSGADGEVRAAGTDTEVDVTVAGADVQTEVNYYTATFYDGTEAYQENTPQGPQIILRGKRVDEPEKPDKENRRFAGWKTENGGSTPYDFDKSVTETIGIYASWEDDAKPAVTYTITATAGEGGSISPSGDVVVEEGTAQRFAVAPGEGYRIMAVTVDGKDATADLSEGAQKEQTAEKYYMFSDVRADHAIHAEFAANNTLPDAGGDKPDDENGSPDSGGDKPDDGDDSPDSGGDKPDDGDGSLGGGEDKPGDGVGSTAKTGETQTAAVVKDVAPQAESSTASDAAPPVGKEPKTGDPTPVEIYATVAMVAGLTYLLLFFMEESRGMTEREKEVFVAAFIRWAKKGGRFRKCCAIAAIFCLLAYYHSIGKCAEKGALQADAVGN